MRAVACSVVVSCCLALAACAGFRGGWESIPYVGDTPPSLPESRTAFEARQRSRLHLSGITLDVGLNNQTRAYDMHVILFALPVMIDPRTVQTQRVEPGRTRVSINVTGTDGDFVLRARQAKLIVAGKAVSAIGAYEFGMWDSAGNRVSSGGEWAHRPLDDEHAIGRGARSDLLSIEFPVPTPSPAEPGIALDLSEALRATGKPAIPLIRFHPTRWKEGYT